MNLNLTTSYEATQTERSRLARQAERGWQVEQAAAFRPVSRRVRLRAVLELAAQRLRGTSRGVRTRAFPALTQPHS